MVSFVMDDKQRQRLNRSVACDKDVFRICVGAFGVIVKSVNIFTYGYVTVTYLKRFENINDLYRTIKVVPLDVGFISKGIDGLDVAYVTYMIRNLKEEELG